MTEAVLGLVELATRPVPGDRPTGSNARYEPEYDDLKAEIEKVSAVGAGEVDWGKVADLSRAILEGKSKDLLVLSYLCAASFERSGYAALAEGLEAIRSMCETYWDDLFPETKRMKGRIAALQWLVERVAAVVERRSPTAVEAESVAKAIEGAGALETSLVARLGQDTPSFGDCKRALEARKTAPPPSRPAATPARPAAAAPSATQAAAGALPAGDFDSAEGREATMKALVASLKEIAPALRRATPTDPLGYRLARVAAWARLRDVPPDEDGRTSVPPMGADPDTAKRLETLASQGNWPELVQEAETQFLRSVLWLDLQRWTVLGLEGIGPAAFRAATAVKDDARALMAALPRLAELRFANDHPFASPETRLWLETALAAGPAPSSKPSAALPLEDDAAASVEAARRAAAEGKVDEAIADLEREIRRSQGVRRKFLLRVALAGILYDSKEARVAAAQMEALEEETRSLRIEDWEPELAVEATKVHLQAQRAVAREEGKRSPEAAERAKELYAKLARMDVAAARSMQG